MEISDEIFGFLSETHHYGKEFDLTVLIPTFHERENISRMILSVDQTLNQSGIRGHILIVDDNSGDGTIEEVKALFSSMKNVSLIVRHENHGLSSSLYQGFYASPTPLVQCIDCDFSHPPELIPSFFQKLRDEECDIVIGSRYIRGGGSVNWPITRRILSFGAAMMGRLLIPVVSDSGSGFFAINTRVLAGAHLKPRGFRMCFEILGKGNWRRVDEIPFVFRNRDVGKSKLKPLIILQFLIQTLGILIDNFILKKSANIMYSWTLHFSR